MSHLSGVIYTVRWNGGSYVGQSHGHVLCRWQAHMSALRAGTHFNKRFQQGYNNVGICGLSFSILEYGVDWDDLNSREHFWTDSLGSVNEKPWMGKKISHVPEILDLIKRGYTYRDIRDKIGVSLGTITTINRKHKSEQIKSNEHATPNRARNAGFGSGKALVHGG